METPARGGPQGLEGQKEKRGCLLSVGKAPTTPLFLGKWQVGRDKVFPELIVELQ